MTFLFGPFQTGHAQVTYYYTGSPFNLEAANSLATLYGGSCQTPGFICLTTGNITASVGDFSFTIVSQGFTAKVNTANTSALQLGAIFFPINPCSAANSPMWSLFQQGGSAVNLVTQGNISCLYPGYPNGDHFLFLTSGNISDATPLIIGATSSLGVWTTTTTPPTCAQILINSVSEPHFSGQSSSTSNDPTIITAAFSPNYGLTLQQAAQACGFTGFNWIQKTTIPAPSPFYAANLPSGTPTRVVGPTFDPPPNGGWTSEEYALANDGTVQDPVWVVIPGPYPTGDNSYPFYLNGADLCTQGACAPTSTSLPFVDSPADPCLPNADGSPSLSYYADAPIPDQNGVPTTVQTLCNFMTVPLANRVRQFQTILVGILPSFVPGTDCLTLGTCVDLGQYGTDFSWGNTYNGTSGGQTHAKSLLPVDPGSGSGGSTLLSAALTVTETGGGAVTSSPPGIQCGATCGANFAVGSQVTLTATPASGGNFSGWMGACSGTGTCTVTMTGGQRVAATFSQESSPTVTSISPLSGPPAGGTSVTITGTTLTAVTAVQFGSTNATSFSVSSTTSITATSPAGSGIVDVTVTTAGGTSASSAADRFTYVGTATNNTVLTASPNPSTSGQSVTFTATVTSSGGTPTGMVTFYDGATALGSATLSGGTATFTTALLSVGGHSITAVYGGDANFAASTSSTLTQTVNVPQITYGLTVSVSGNGTVTSSPSGLNCVATCSASFASGTQVTLTATPATGSSFTGWSGACNGTSTCSVAMNAAQSVAANFASGGARASQTWVSATSGSDANPCTRSSPCLTFAAALAQTPAGGEIDVLDPGDFGPVTVNKSVSIYGNAASGAGTIPSPGTSGIVISAGANDAVNLRDLIFDGAGASGTSGVAFNSGGRLHIQRCVIQGFSSTGITLSPGTGSASTVNVSIQNTAIINNSAGIVVKPSGGIAVEVSLNGVKIDNNTGGGLRVDGTAGTGAINLAIADSSVSFNASNGINAVSGPGNVNVDIVHAVVAANALAGIQANQSKGAIASVTVGGSVIHGNNAALEALGGASLLTYSNNQITGNIANGTGFTGGATLQ
jgi:hypothetical protein